MADKGRPFKENMVYLWKEDMLLIRYGDRHYLQCFIKDGGVASESDNWVEKEGEQEYICTVRELVEALKIVRNQS